MLAPAEIPSPVVAVWNLGPVPIRAYSLCLLAGIVLATWLTARRMAIRGVDADTTIDVAMWAVPFGIVGGRIYRVLSSPQQYFGEGGDPLSAFAVWEGGLGIWGAVAFGAVGAWIGCRRHGVRLMAFGDALAPGLALAQAVGRWGNWFNNELYGGPTDLPWALRIHQWDFAAGRAVVDASGQPVVIGTFHPTFLYEFLWCVLIAGVLFALDRRWGPTGDRRLVEGQLFAAYMMLYTAGRVFIENVRVDEANHLLGLRLNVWTSMVVFLAGAVLYGWLAGRRGSNESVAPHTAGTVPGDLDITPEAAAGDPDIEALRDAPDSPERGPAQGR